MENPTYRDLGDHSETIQIDYDPTQISYGDLLDVFWASHDPTAPSFSRQYASLILYHDEEQKRLAIESKAREEARRGERISTEIIPLSQFYLAEDYHQKYRLQNRPQFMNQFRAMYPDFDEFVNSTAAARVNGYLGGHGTAEALEAELDDLGLSPQASTELRSRVR